MEFRALERYALDTHGATHSYYKVQVESIFKIEREGEKERWEGSEWSKSDVGKNAERYLLWHGSRSTNFAGEFFCLLYFGLAACLVYYRLRLVVVADSRIMCFTRYIEARSSHRPSGSSRYWLRASTPSLV